MFSPRFHLLLCFALFLSGCASSTPLATPLRTFNVRDFGATGDGTNKDTVAFQKTLDACAVSGGGEVLVPAGKYLIGSIQMGNRTTLRLAADSVLLGSGDTNDYLMLDVRWEGRWQPGRRALIYSADVADTGIVGPGRIEGNRDMAAPQNPRGSVVLESVHCRGVRWEGFTVTQGGNWATHPTCCTDVTIRNVKIVGDRDGIDIDSCQRVLITGCDLDNGDDCISLKSGRGLNGARVGLPTADVTITDCTMRGRRFASIGIGSETSGGIRDVRIARCRMTSRTFGVYIKTRIGRGGSIENIKGHDLDILGGGFLKINLVGAGNLNTADDPVEGDAGIPMGRNYRFSDVRISNGSRLVDAKDISPVKPLQGLTLANLTGTCSNGMVFANIRDLKLSGVHVTGYQGAWMTVTNVTGSGLTLK